MTIGGWNSQVTSNKMLSTIKLKSIFACCVLGFSTSGISVGAQIAPANAEAMTRQAIDLFKQGMLSDAVAAQKKTVAANPSSGLAHASLSYLAWKQGDMLAALNEGEAAVKIDGEQVVYLINLALMLQDAQGFPEAVELFTHAHKLVPESWVPLIGLARCDILTGHQDKGNAALASMAGESGRSFEWYYMTAKTAVENDQLKTALGAVAKAMGVASTEPQKAAVSGIALLAALRSKDLPVASALLSASMKGIPPRTPEIYVRSASLLVAPSEPEKGTSLLDCAVKNLDSAADTETFLKMGQLFEEKSRDAACNADSRKAWLANARAAYANASRLRPNVPSYHLAQAAVLYRMGMYSESAEEFKKQAALEKNEMLPPFLAKKLLEAQAADNKQPVSLSLSRVRFTITGLSCACKLSRIRQTLRDSGVVVFVNTASDKKPYAGQILVDRTVDAKELLHQCEGMAIPHSPNDTAPPDDLKMEITSKEPVATPEEAIKIVERLTFGPIMVFGNTFADYANRYKEVGPVIPVSDNSTAGDIKNGAAWRTPL